jgi:hypothetical protein
MRLTPKYLPTAASLPRVTLNARSWRPPGIFRSKRDRVMGLQHAVMVGEVCICTVRAVKFLSARRTQPSSVGDHWPSGIRRVHFQFELMSQALPMIGPAVTVSEHCYAFIRLWHALTRVPEHCIFIQRSLGVARWHALARAGTRDSALYRRPGNSHIYRGSFTVHWSACQCVPDQTA